MPEIIILFVVIGIIGNIIKAVGGQGTQNKPPTAHRDPREVFREMMEQGQKRMDAPEQKAIPQKNEQQQFPQADVIKPVAHGRLRSNYTLNDGNISAPLQVISLDDEEKSARQIFITGDSVLNGIIFSEILQKPKALRR